MPENSYHLPCLRLLCPFFLQFLERVRILILQNLVVDVHARVRAVINVRRHEYEQLAFAMDVLHVLEEPADDRDGAEERELFVHVVLAFLDHAAEDDRLPVAEPHG